ncbi:hypothetical protein [Sinimarinibacterium flocculans]|uniref:hypothetical protein n=1 Tax=Sinimarinibacterium flocculans TaxID=985250 RepID=UPI003C75D018
MKKRFITIWLVGFASLATFGILAGTVHEAFFFGCFVVIIVVSTALMNVSCPHCGTAVLYRDQKAFGLSINGFRPWPPDHCPNCKRELPL